MPRLTQLVGLALVACAAPHANKTDTGGTQSSPPPVNSNGHDWPTFNFDAGRSGSFDASTGITEGNIATMQRQQVTIDGTVDASAIYLHNVQVNGAAHDVFFMTTTYGKTLAVDANDGTVLWRFTPASFSQLSGSARITNVTPVADPDRTEIYTASPDGNVEKLSVADGHAIWTTPITTFAQREKIASSLNYSGGHIIAVTGGYISDAPPYQGHVSVLNVHGPAPPQLELVMQRSRWLDRSLIVRAERVGDLGAVGRRRRCDWQHLRRHRQWTLGWRDQLG